MATFLLTWNPEKWQWENLNECIEQKNNPGWEFKWSCGNNKSIQKGDRFFIIRLGKNPKGIFCSGWAASDSYEDDHYDEMLAKDGKKSQFVKINIEYLLNPELEPILPRNDLNNGILQKMHWDSQSSGVRIPDEIAVELEKTWKNFLSQNNSSENLQNHKENKERNPPWQRDELILALDLYFRHHPSHINQNHEEVVRLSEILNRLPIRIELKNSNKFRNPNGVYMKLCNYLRYDPNYHGTGLQRGGKLEEVIWNEFANNREYLRKVAQGIIDSLETRRNIKDDKSFPFTVFSWTIITPNIFLKTLDKSAFYHHGTGIPIEIREFFDVHQLHEGERKDIILEHNKIQYQAHIEMESTDTLRTRMFWRADFFQLLKESLPKWYDFFLHEVIDNIDTEEFPKIRFYKDESEDNKYVVEFINPDTIYDDIEKTISDTYQIREEGGVKYYHIKRYERDPKNRKNALEIHGMSCVVCGFNFADFYGEIGEGFIEVHHVEPLSQLTEEIPIDPKTDLFPICPNCHSMIHHGSNEVLTIEQLKKIIQEHKKR